MAIVSRVFLPLAVLAAVLLAGAGGVAAQPDEQPPDILPLPLRMVSLSVGCNNVALTYPDGTAVGVVVGSIDPQGAMCAIWRLNMTPLSPAAGLAFRASRRPRPASDLQGVNFWKPFPLCGVPSSITMPAVQPWPYPVPLPPGHAGPATQ
jgi:hypothetical protein